MCFEYNASLTKINAHYTELSNLLMSEILSKGWSEMDFDDTRLSVCTFKKAVLDLFCPHCEHGLNTLKSHILYHLVEEM